MKSTQDLIEEEFLRLKSQGKIEVLILFNEEGIPMAEVGDFTHYIDTITALSVLFHQSAELLADFETDATINETLIRTTNKFCIVSRPFHINEGQVVLIAIVPQNVSYRKVTNKAVRKNSAVDEHK